MPVIFPYTFAIPGRAGRPKTSKRWVTDPPVEITLDPIEMNDPRVLARAFALLQLGQGAFESDYFGWDADEKEYKKITESCTRPRFDHTTDWPEMSLFLSQNSPDSTSNPIIYGSSGNSSNSGSPSNMYFGAWDGHSFHQSNLGNPKSPDICWTVEVRQGMFKIMDIRIPIVKWIGKYGDTWQFRFYSGIVLAGAPYPMVTSDTFRNAVAYNESEPYEHFFNAVHYHLEGFEGQKKYKKLLQIRREVHTGDMFELNQYDIDPEIAKKIRNFTNSI